MPKFQVLHPVLHDNKTYDRGTTVVLSPKDGDTLHKLGHVGPPVEVETAEDVAATTAALDAMTKSQLVALAADKFELVLSLSLSKTKLIEEIVLAGEIAAESAAKLAKKTETQHEAQE